MLSSEEFVYSTMITQQRALEILKENIENENLRKHHYAVAAAMRALAKEQDGDPEKWEIVGLLHDADYEETKDDPERHAALIAGKLEEEGVDEDIVYAIKAHNYEYLEEDPKSKMDWSLVACDDLTGLIVAVALVHPNKLEGVSVESVLKKFNSSSFAAGADRERIKKCEENLDIPLEEFVRIVLSAMKKKRDQLGL
ncbi:MAG: HDIG domain-containing metalloprotein [Patescibacteria group bacterium]